MTMGATTTTYTWDNNGNTKTENAGAAGVTATVYDEENRLLTKTNADLTNWPGRPEERSPGLRVVRCQRSKHALSGYGYAKAK